MTNINLHFQRISLLALLGLCLAGSAWAAIEQPTFPSANEAAQSLFQAVQSNNEQTIAQIMGGPTELTTSHDPGQDKAERELFVKKYQEMHRLHREPDGSTVLYIGMENWPFPVPLIKTNGAWRFDPDAGKSEVLFRRIGENELTAIAKCKEFRGSAGGDPVLVDGYYFRVVPVSSGKGTALIAYPAEYRSSGVMTFVKKDGIIYEKDLGENTPKLASTMTAFRKDRTWRQDSKPDSK